MVLDIFHVWSIWLCRKENPSAAKTVVKLSLSFLQWDGIRAFYTTRGQVERRLTMKQLWSDSMEANTGWVSYLTIISSHTVRVFWKPTLLTFSQIWMSKKQPRVRSNPVPLIHVGMHLSWWHHSVVRYGWITRLSVVEASGLRSRSYQ